MSDATPPTLRILIADDEPLARRRLIDLVQRQRGAEVVGQAGNGREAVEAIHRLRPDLVFLDVQMPGLTGPEVVRAVGPERMPVTIFVTAYDEYALGAFELAALDYLLKPYEDERFEQAFARARKQIGLNEVGGLQARLEALLGRASPAEDGAAASDASTVPDESGYVQRLPVEMRGQVRVVRVADIACITASGPYAELHVGGHTYVIRERMQTLEDRLDPDQFFRIHRSTIVRLDEVEALLNSGGGDYAVRLRSGQHFSVSRSRYAELERRLGLDALRSDEGGDP